MMCGRVGPLQPGPWNVRAGPATGFSASSAMDRRMLGAVPRVLAAHIGVGDSAHKANECQWPKSSVMFIERFLQEMHCGLT